MRGLLVALLLASTSFAAQRGTRPPAPVGQDLVANDGDRVIIEGNARVQIVNRRQGMVRAIFNETLRYLIVLVDYAPNAGEVPDGNVDFVYRFSDLEGMWPLETRWEGFTTFDEYLHGPSSRGFGLNTPIGLVQIQLRSGPPELQPLRDASAVAVLSARGLNSSGLGRIPPVSFDQIEQEQTAQAARATRQDGRGASMSLIGSVDGVAGAGFSTWSSSSAGNAGAPPVTGGVRVGGAVRPPQKTRDVAPVYPDQARQANVRGVVILEVTVGVDGSVSDARVLRGIPLLDEAAIAAVRQWQYQPTLLNGVAVPLIMTVTVPFAP